MKRFRIYPRLKDGFLEKAKPMMSELGLTLSRFGDNEGGYFVEMEGDDKLTVRSFRPYRKMIRMVEMEIPED